MSLTARLFGPKPSAFDPDAEIERVYAKAYAKWDRMRDHVHDLGFEIGGADELARPLFCTQCGSAVSETMLDRHVVVCPGRD